MRADFTGRANQYSTILSISAATYNRFRGGVKLYSLLTLLLFGCVFDGSCFLVGLVGWVFDRRQIAGDYGCIVGIKNLELGRAFFLIAVVRWAFEGRFGIAVGIVGIVVI